ncbi:hypothetical protein HAX54_048869 [Datura stramonium]|uniref:Secreted protein n=1 Tax=Datura stramonium TaxID=4076 RepID=A0ABS8WNJ0_DATST|nr:hypothetical protein [Datura stramonium]
MNLVTGNLFFFLSWAAAAPTSWESSCRPLISQRRQHSRWLLLVASIELCEDGTAEFGEFFRCGGGDDLNAEVRLDEPSEPEAL